MKKYALDPIRLVLLPITVFVLVIFSYKIALASGVLSVTGVSSIKTTGIANDTYTDGWKWVFHITLPSNENLVRMRFGDFSNSQQTIPANNIRLYSAQSVNSNNEATATYISAPDVYSDQININPALDLDPVTDGIQIDINVDTKIPFGITGSGYSTSYDIVSESPSTTTPDQTPNADVYATTTQITSGLCLSTEVPNNLQMRVSVSEGSVVYGTTTRMYPSFKVSSLADSITSVYGYDWYLIIGVFPEIKLNIYSLLTSEEIKDPFMVGSSTILGRIKFDNVGNITYVESINPSCPKVDVPKVEKPIISSNAPTDVTLVAGQQFSAPLATAWDSVDGDITNKLVYSNNVQIWEPGDYTVGINVINSRGYRADPFIQHVHLLPMTPDMIAKKDLNNTISSISASVDAGVYKVGVNPGEYPQQAIIDLFAVMSEAINVRDNPSSVASDYIDANSKLNNAILTFISKKII